MSTSTFPSNGKVASKEDAIALLTGDGQQPATPQKQKPQKPTAQPKQAASKEDAIDLLSGTVKKKDSGSGSLGISSQSIAPSQPTADMYGNAVNNYKNKKLTPEDIDILQGTDFGKQNGLTGLGPEAKKIFAQAHNSPKQSDLDQEVFNTLDKAFPKTDDPKLNQARTDIMKGVSSGDQSIIKATKDKITANFQKNIDNIIKSRTSPNPLYGAVSGQSPTIVNLSETDKKAIDSYRAQLKQANDVLNDYSVNAAANSKEMQAQVRAEVSGKQYSTGSAIAAQDLGKHIEKIYGGLPNPNGNMDYEREKVGLNALIEAKRLKLNNLITQGLATKDQSILDQAKKETEEINKYKGWQENLIDKFPDVGTTMTARIIGDEIADTHPRNMIISKSDVQESAARIESKYPGFLAKYGKFVDVVAESEGSGIGAIKSGLVPKGGITGGLQDAIEQLAYGGAKLIAGAVGDTKTKQAAEAEVNAARLQGTKFSGEAPTKIVYDSEGKAFTEKPNEDYGKVNWNSAMRFIGKSVPGLASWVVAEEATGGVAALAGASKAGQATAGIIGASYITSYDDNYKYADNLIEDKSTLGTAKKVALADFLTLTTAGIFKMIGYSPSKFVENAITKSISTDAMQLLEENGWKQLPKNKVQAFLSDVVLPKAKSFGKDAASSFGEGAKVGAATVTDTKIKDFVSTVINPEKSQPSTDEDNIKQFAQQAFFMGLVGMPKTVINGFSSPSMKDAFYEVGTRAPQYIERVNQQIASGDLTEEKGNLAIATAKTMAEEVNKAQSETTKDGLPLSLNQKKEIALQNFRKRAAAKMEEMGQDIGAEKINSEADKEIKNIKNENTHLPLDETHAFKTAKEIDDEGNASKRKIATFEDIDPEKKYSWENNDNKEKTGTGAQLISFLTQSKEYEKSDKTATSENTETKSGDKKAESENTEAADKIAHAKSVVDKAIDDKKLEGVYVDAAKKDPVKFLQEIHDQITGKNADGTESLQPDAEKATREQFGDEIVDAAKNISSQSKPVSDESKKEDAANAEAKEKGKKENVAPESGASENEPLSYDDFEKQVLDNYLNVKDSKFDWNYTSLLSAKDREKAVSDIKNGIDSAAAKKLKAELKDMHDRGMVTINRGRGNNAESVEIPIKDWLGLDDKERDAAFNMDDHTASIINDNEITSDNIDNLKHLFNGFPYTEDDFNAVKAQLSGKVQGNEKNKGAGGESEEEKIKTNGDAQPNEPAKTTTGNDKENIPSADKTEGADKEAQDKIPPEATEVNNEEKPNAAADALMGSAARLRSGETTGLPDEEGAKILEEQAKKLQGQPPKNNDGATTEKKIPENGIGIKNSIVNESRVHRGLLPYVRAAKEKLGDTWDKVKKKVASGLLSPDKLVNDTYAAILRNEKIAFTNEQNAELLFHRIDVTNRLKTAQDMMGKLEGLATDATPEKIQEIFKENGDWVFADAPKFDELLKDPEVTPELVSQALNSFMEDMHNDLEKNDKVANATGREWGLSGRFRQILTDLQGEVVDWGGRLERKMGDHADPEVLKTVSNLESHYKDVIEQLKKTQSEDLQKAAEDAYNKAKAAFQKGKVDKTAKAKTLKQSGADWADKISKLKIKTDPNALQSNLLGLPIAVYNTLIDTISGLVKGGASIADAIDNALKDARFKDAKKDEVVNHLVDRVGFEEKRENYLGKIENQSKKDNATSITKDNVNDVKALMALHIKNGATNLDEVISKTKEDIKNILTDASDDDIRDALSGRGVKAETKITAQSELQRLKQKASDVGKYKELLTPPQGETDSQRINRVKRLNELYEGKDGNGIKDEIRKMGITPPGEQLRLKEIEQKRFDSTKQGVQKVIDKAKGDISDKNTPFENELLKNEQQKLASKLKEVDTGRMTNDQRNKKAMSILSGQVDNYKAAREKLTSLFRKDKPAAGSPEAIQEKQQVDAYTKRIKSLEKSINEINIDNRLISKDFDKEVLAAKLTDSLNNSISGIQNKLDNNEFETPEILKEVGLESGIGEPDPSRTQKIRDLQRQKNLLELKRRDAEDKYFQSKKGIAAKIASAAVSLKRKFVLVKLGILAKLGAVVTWSQAAFRPMENLAGAIWNKIGDATSFVASAASGKKYDRDASTWGRFLDKSLRYGRRSAKAELEAYGRTWSYDNFKKGKGILGFTSETAKKMDGFKNESTLKSFVSNIANGYDELSIMFGKDVAPSEFYANVSDDPRFFQKAYWQTIGDGLNMNKNIDVAKAGVRSIGKIGGSLSQLGEYGIRSHGAVKSISKGMEFARSYFTIKENAKRIYGEDWANDPVNQMQMGAIAYQEAVRTILMEDNKLSELYQNFIKTLSKSQGTLGQATYALAGELFPVAKVPTNIALNAARAVTGLPLSGGEIALRLMAEKLSGTKIAEITKTGEFLKKNGTESVSPEKASALLRNLATGTVGAFVTTGMILGALSASHYYFRHKNDSLPEEAEPEKKLQEGEIKIGDVTIPKDLADNPYFVAMKMGSTMIDAYNYYNSEADGKDADGFLLSSAKALGVAAGGVIKESPIASSSTDALRLLEGQQNMGWWARGLVVSSTLPSESREIAEWMDKEDGSLIPYASKVNRRLQPTLGDTYKAWLPWERQSLDLKP